MKRLLTALALMLTITLSTAAMSYEQARDQALFLADKMAYELNLTDQQYEAAYEINLDYLMRIDNVDDLYGLYWKQRNLDLSYILLDWQYRAYMDASYFYRPLYWNGGYWHFGIYARYPHRDFFYFGCPNFVFTYSGGHSWHHNGGRSWYCGRRWNGPHDFGPHPGMRRNWDTGRYGAGFVHDPGQRTWAKAPQRLNRPNDNRTFGNMRQGEYNDSPLRNGNRTFGTPRQSSTRSTANRSFGSNPSGNHSFGNGSFGNRNSTPRETFQPQQSRPARSFSSPSRSSSPNSFGGKSNQGGSFGNRGNGGRSFGGGNGAFGRR